MNWNSIHRGSSDSVRQRLLAILAAQGVLTDEMMSRVRDDSDDVLEIEITEFEGCIGRDDDDDDVGEPDDDEGEEDDDQPGKRSGKRRQ